MVEFENYHAHTCLSNRSNWPDSAVFIKDYAEEYKKRGHKVLCISEHGNRSDVWSQFDICESYKANGYDMKPIAAAEAYYVPDRLAEVEGKKDDRHFHLILVAKNMEGYYQLNEALSEANLSGYYRYPRVDLDILSTKLNYKNFICTTACIGGIVKDENFEKRALELHDIFRENFYLEIQHHPQKAQLEANMKILRMYGRYHIPLIYATDSHYINKEDKIIRHELLVSKRKGVIENDDDFDLYLPTAEEAFTMLQNQGIFTKARIEEAMENTLILREFEGVKFSNEKKIPNSHPEMTLEERNELYRKLCYSGYESKSGTPTPEEKKEIDDEIDAVTETSTADYFLIAKRVVDRAKEFGGRLTLTGRGSGSSFCTNYCLGFTTLNRLHSPVKLYPERFISKERMASGILPDLDLNLSNVEAFEKAGKEILGEFGCLPMIKYDTAKTLAAFKLLAKARNIDFETSNAVSKQISSYELDVKHAIENNQDDPDYNVDDDVQIEAYVEQKYLGLIEDSKKYQKIILTKSPHPCAHLLFDGDIRREIGVVRLKDDLIAANIDGTTADAYGYLKLDFLTVTVVDLIYDAFEQIHKTPMNVDELLRTTQGDVETWRLYANGFTQCLNQCEQEKSSARAARFRPKNIVELAGFVGAIRPGFKSMLDTFITRTPFKYNINSLDKLLQTKEMKSSFLLYDEQVLSVLIAAGIPASDAYVCLKAIKKKKAEKVAPFKKLFKEGFSKHLQENEGKTKEEADKVCDQILKILEDSAQYLFNASHALCVACDSLYAAYLKAHYPYEFYLTALKIYDKKKDKNKISSLIAEMNKYKHIQFVRSKWETNNSDWVEDKAGGLINQSLSSVKYMSKTVAEELYTLSQQSEAYIGSEMRPDIFTPEAKKEIAKIRKRLKPLQEKAEAYLANGGDEFDEEFLAMYDEGYPLEQEIKKIENNDVSYVQRAGEVKHYAKLDCFTNVLRAIQMGTCLDTRQIEILIGLNYFQKFGKTGKLMQIYQYFFNGEKKITKQHKSFNERLELCRQYENSLADVDLPAGLRLRYEMENIGLCLSTDPIAPNNAYFVTSIDDKYSIKLNLYNIRRGTSGLVKVAKKDYHTVAEGSCITIENFRKGPKYTYAKGQKTIIPGESEIWVTNYKVLQKGEGNVA